MPSSVEVPRRSKLRLGLGLVLLVGYTGFIFSVTLSPRQLDVTYQNVVLRLIDALHRNGVPQWFGYGEVEFLANVGMFVPFGFLLAMLLPSRVSWLSLFAGPALSGFVENFQRQFLDERVASIDDVWANSAGTVIGWLLFALIRGVIYSRDRRVIARALWQYEQGLPPTGH